jgi:hypothetical protein
MHFSRLEWTFLFGVCVLSCLLGALAGFASLTDQLHLQSCGGVLDEDVPAVMWHNTWTTGLTFAEVALITFVALGGVPMSLQRLLIHGARR